MQTLEGKLINYIVYLQYLRWLLFYFYVSTCVDISTFLTVLCGLFVCCCCDLRLSTWE